MSRPFELDDVRSIVTVAETAIAPDGRSVVFERSEADGEGRATSLWRAAPGAAPVRLTAGPADTAPRFAPDGRAVLFLRAVDGVAQLHRIAIDGGEAAQLTFATDLPLGAGAPAISPDGARIAFSAPVDREPGAADAPIVIDALGHKSDGIGWIGAIRRHLFVLDTATGEVRRLTDGDWDASEPAFSPDGTRLAFTAAVETDADLTKQTRAWVTAVDAKLPELMPAGRATSVTGPLLWDPDGSAVYGVGAAAPRVGNAGLLRLAVGTDEADVELTADLDRNVMAGAPAYPGGRPAFATGGTEIVFCLRERGWTHLHAIARDGSRHRAVVADPHRVVSSLSVAADAPRAAFVQTTPDSYGEVALVDLETGAVEVLTTLTADAMPDVELFRAQEREFTISDGSTVHGWLLAAPDTIGPAPLLLDIHGGPHNAWSGVADDIHLYQQLLAARGWRVLMVNPRGSDGYGDAFMRGVHGGWGSADLQDFLEPVDDLVAEGLADADRLAVTGYSYGGFGSCELTTRTDRFAAAVAGGLICDFVPLAADSENSAWFSEMTAGVDPTSGHRALLEASPISRVEAVTTPTLVLHGADDDICPVGQAQEWFSALRVRGVPTRLVVYPGGSHLFPLAGATSHRIDYHRRVVEWVEQYTRVTKRPRAVAPASRSAAAWRRRLDVLRERYGVTGAQFGIVALDELDRVHERTTVSSGVLDATIGTPVGDDALFQIGSITKVWTTILLMQLVDEGLLDLDAPVRSVLPDFALGDADVAATVTVRSLLSHTSGIDGDVFTDTGRGDDCVEAYVQRLGDVRQIHPLDERFSYCNSGFVIAGRIVEVLRGTTWDEALRVHVIEPMGLRHTITMTDDAPRFATANGHGGFGAEAVAVPVWPIARSMGPAGLIAASVGDVLTFAQTALRGGVAPNGTRILSEASAAAMLEQQVDLRSVSPATAGWGLGWFLEDWNGVFVYGHDGGTIGQRAYLRIFPDARYALVLLTSGGRADGLYRELLGDAAASIDGSVLPRPLRAGSVRTRRGGSARDLRDRRRPRGDRRVRGWPDAGDDRVHRCHAHRRGARDRPHRTATLRHRRRVGLHDPRPRRLGPVPSGRRRRVRGVPVPARGDLVTTLVAPPPVVAEAEAQADALAVAAGVQIRELHEPAEMVAASALLADIWRTDRSRSQLDPGMLVALAHAGNYVTGAFRGGELVGVCVGFFHPPADAALHSHIAGVVEGLVGVGIGKAMKFHQRAWAMRHGAETMTWTYDPLVARNAYFNIHRLGGSATEYLPDFYGEMRDGLNRGQPSDRMLLVWELAAAATVHDGQGALAPAVLESVDERPRLDLAAASGTDRCRIEIPSDIEGLRRTAPDAAVEWRHALRQALTGLLGSGWRITDFDRRGHYLLERTT